MIILIAISGMQSGFWRCFWNGSILAAFAVSALYVLIGIVSKKSYEITEEPPGLSIPLCNQNIILIKIKAVVTTYQIRSSSINYAGPNFKQIGT